MFKMFVIYFVVNLIMLSHCSSGTVLDGCPSCAINMIHVQVLLKNWTKTIEVRQHHFNQQATADSDFN